MAFTIEIWGVCAWWSKEKKIELFKLIDTCVATTPSHD